MKMNVQNIFGALALVSSLAFASEQEQNYLKSQWFLEKLLLSKGANLEVTAYNKIITLDNADCEIKLEENLQNYSSLRLHKKATNTYETTYYSAKSKLTLQQNNSIVESFQIEEHTEFDCEEEGCSQETTLHQNFSSTKIELEDVYQGNDYGYKVIRTSCDL